MLRIADYLAAPFGSAEYLTVRYGRAGADYELEDGTPAPSGSTGAASQLGVKYVTDAPIVNFVPGGHWDELAMHVRAAVRNGLTADEIKEVLLQTAIYCSVPSANRAFKIAQLGYTGQGEVTDIVALGIAPEGSTQAYTDAYVRRMLVNQLISWRRRPLHRSERSAARVPRNQARLIGSTPTRAGRP